MNGDTRSPVPPAKIAETLARAMLNAFDKLPAARVADGALVVVWVDGAMAIVGSVDDGQKAVIAAALLHDVATTGHANHQTNVAIENAKGKSNGQGPI